MSEITSIVVIMGLMLQGCALIAVGAGAAAGAGTMAYIAGEFQITYGASLDRTWNATLESLKELDFRIINNQKDEVRGDIEAKKIGGDKVRVYFSIAGPGTTLVKIRVGFFGDEELSRAISNKITSKLGEK